MVKFTKMYTFSVQKDGKRARRGSDGSDVPDLYRCFHTQCVYMQQANVKLLS